jgi:hypothetical protein
MRIDTRQDGFSLRAISGTRSIMLAMNARRDRLTDFLGFAIGRRASPGARIYWLNGFRCFREVEPDPGVGQRFSTSNHPIQGFQWGFHAAEPDTDYHFVVRPLFRPSHGDLRKMRPGTGLEISIRSESEASGKHSVLFNRGAIVSQAYAERFSNDLPPEELDAELNDPTSERAIWLSRGLLEGALAFIGQARDSRFSLHCGFYELTYAPILDALAQAAARGARVEVTYEAGHYQVRNERRVETKYGQMNAEAISPYQGQANLYFRERIHHIRLTHNKFMVLCENGSPIEVWTGSTNISPSGFLGQSNNGHVVRDETIARLYFDYFEQLARDERRVAFRQFNVDLTPDPPDALPDGTTVLFSPRRGTKLLDWYGARMDRATQTVILTSAFGVTPRLAAHFDNERDYLRYVLMEQRSRGVGAQEMVERDPNTRVVFGQGLGVTGRGNWRKIPGWALESWMRREEHFRRSGYVFFVHTKYMGIDVMSDTPSVFTGSANFSPNSISDNDENMLLIQGNTSVADIYTTEFFRLLNHFYFRQVANRKAEDGKSDPDIRFLDPTDAWVAGHFRDPNYRSKRRELFGVAP